MGYRAEVMNESIQHDLCRKNADERHVVFHADSFPTMKFLNEPRHGIRIEDTLVVTENGSRNLTAALPRDAREIEKLVGK